MRGSNFLPGKIAHIKHIGRLFAEGRDMRRGYVEAEPGHNRRQFIKQARPIEAGHFDDGEAVGKRIVDRYFWMDAKNISVLSGLPRPCGDHVPQPDLPAERALDSEYDAAR